MTTTPEREALAAEVKRLAEDMTDRACSGDGFIAKQRAALYAAIDHIAAGAPAQQPEGDIVITKDDRGQIVAVTRQDAEGRILSVIAESAQDAPAQQPEAADWLPLGLTVESALNRGDDPALLFDENSPIRGELRRLLAILPAATPPAPAQQSVERDAAPELAMMVRMLASNLKKHWPHAPQPNDLPSRAMALLRAHGLQGSPLREDADRQSAALAQQADKEQQP